MTLQIFPNTEDIQTNKISPQKASILGFHRTFQRTPPRIIYALSPLFPLSSRLRENRRRHAIRCRERSLCHGFQDFRGLIAGFRNRLQPV